MTDAFALFGEPRRPWLDPDALKDKLHKWSAVHHPDVAVQGDDKFVEMNAAYRTLHDPKTRLRHLLDLEFPGTLPGSLEIPSDVARLFETMNRERHSVEAFFQKRAHAISSLEIALLASEKLELIPVLEKLLAILNQKHEGMLMQLKFIDAIWEEDHGKSKSALLDTYQSISYIGKWIEQLQNDLTRLEE
jgi:hypothetical protein